MKKTVRNFGLAAMLFLSFNCMFTIAYGQAPQKIGYQGVVRDGSNVLVSLTQVGMQISILQGSSSGTPVYVETQTPTTDINGLATVQIGSGSIITGTMAGIDWSAGPYFIKTETDPAGGTTYSITSTSELLSVPYALFAANPGPAGPAGNGIASTVNNGDGTFTITYTDATTFTSSDLTGPQGPQGPAGADGAVGPQGPAGVLSVNCLECHDHNSATSGSALAQKRDNAENEYEYSKHAESGELAIEEGYTAGCAPCHANEGFHSVVDAGTVPNMTSTGTPLKYTYAYNASAAMSSGLTTMPGKISCFTCHKGAAADSMARYTTAPVPMCMYPTGTGYASFNKTIDLTQNNSESNLCVKCHQPRPMTLTSSTTVTLANGTVVTLDGNIANGNSVNYPDLAANPMALFYDSTIANANTNKLFPGYRTHNHYGAIGAIFAGKGGVEFTSTVIGTYPYTDISTHTTDASCQNCHMATPTGFTGGHSMVVGYIDTTTTARTYNFKGCNVSGCHSSSPLNATHATFTSQRNATAALLDSISNRLQDGGIKFMHKNVWYSSNPFRKVTTAGYDGYFDIYDPSSNPGGAFQNPTVSSSWTAAQKATNLTKPRFPSLTNLEMGAIINFQLSVREFSLGVHNPAYTKALLNNTLQALRDNNIY